MNLCHLGDGKGVREAVAEAITSRRVDMVCTGGPSLRWGQVQDVLSSAKEVDPHVITVAGGPIVTADPELALSHLPMDYGVVGEGEYTVAELVEVLSRQGDPRGVRGLAFRDQSGDLVLTGPREEIEGLDTLPFPEYEDFGFSEWTGLAKYAQQITLLESFGEVRYAEIIGSRSCPFSCTFCYHPIGKKYRQRSLDHIFGEIDLLVERYGVNVIYFADELFSADRKRMAEFAERIRPYNVKWLAQLRVNDVSLEMLHMLVDSGLMYATFGIESMNDAVLRSMKKHTTRAEIINALKLAREAGLYCSGNIILGDPADTRETVWDSIDWWRENNIYNVSLGFIFAVPDAPVYRQAIERGIIRDRLAHVRGKFQLVNMSRLSDHEYYNLVMKVTWWNLTKKNMARGILESSRKLEEKHKGKHFYTLRIRCPFCSQSREYRRFMASRSPSALIVCEGCFASMRVSQEDAFYDEYSAAGTFAFMAFELAKACAQRSRFLRENRMRIKQMIDKVKALHSSTERRG